VEPAPGVLPVNENGLTYARWYRAAMFGVPAGRRLPPGSKVLRTVWKNGEDPTDWAASF